MAERITTWRGLRHRTIVAEEAVLKAKPEEMRKALDEYADAKTDEDLAWATRSDLRMQLWQLANRYREAAKHQTDVECAGVAELLESVHAITEDADRLLCVTPLRVAYGGYTYRSFMVHEAVDHNPLPVTQPKRKKARRRAS